MKERVITFKVSQQMYEKLSAMENTSDFIRDAIDTKLNTTCPLCLGRGELKGEQLEHLKAFLKTHQIIKSNCCHENIIICNKHHLKQQTK